MKYWTTNDIEAITKEANARLERVYAEWFPNHRSPMLSTGAVRTVLEAAEKRRAVQVQGDDGEPEPAVGGAGIEQPEGDGARE